MRVRDGDQPSTGEEYQQADERVHDPSGLGVAVVAIGAGFSNVKKRRPTWISLTSSEIRRPSCDPRKEIRRGSHH